MMTISGYENLRLIQKSSNTEVFAGNRTTDQKPVLLRTHRRDTVTPNQIANYQSEFTLLGELNSSYICKPLELLEHNDLPILVLEATPGLTFKDYLDEYNPTYTDSIKIALSITRGIDYLHGKNIIHKNISPENIRLDPVSLHATFFGFSIATHQTTMKHRPHESSHFEGRLGYISPEQTGRLNRTVDYRTDYYSLGILLYELVTGKPAFPLEDPLHSIYNHIVATPVSPLSLNSNVSKELDKVIMKLLEKMPENRYQSIFAIQQDLQACLQRLANPNNANAVFSVAVDDIPEKLTISEVLVGRKAQFSQLEEAFERARIGSTEIVVCSGSFGSGKSSFIREQLKDIIAADGFYISASQDSSGQDIPYSIISSLLKDMIKSIITRPDLTSIKQSLQYELQQDIDILLELAPELDLLLEPRQTGVTSLAPIEARAKLSRSLTTLIKVLNRDKSPLVMSIDNIHWIDQASIKLLATMLRDQPIPNLLAICTLQPDLSMEEEALQQLPNIVGNFHNITEIRISSLTTADIATLISQSTYRSRAESLPLAEIVSAKTGGNASSVRTFLEKLDEEGIIYFDRKHREWNWDLPKAKEQNPTAMVSQQLAKNFSQFNELTTSILQVAACYGLEFDLSILSDVVGITQQEIANNLLPTLKAGYVTSLPSFASNQRQVSSYKFSHVDIQQAAYSQLDLNKKREYHEKLGLILLARTSKTPADNIFEIVIQLNCVIGHQSSAGLSSQQLSKLNTLAGEKAQSSAAFHAAFKYFKTAIFLLGQNPWTEYEDCLHLHQQASENAYLCRDKDQLKVLLESIHKNAHSILDESLAYELEIRSLIAEDRITEALDLGFELLKQLKVKLPNSLNSPLTYWMALKLVLNTSLLSETTLDNSKKMTDPKFLAAMRILMILIHASYVRGSNFTGVLVIKANELSLKYGNAPESYHAYPMFGAALIGLFGAIDTGYKFGKVALHRINEQDRSLQCKTLTLVHSFIFVWKHHLNKTIEPSNEAYRLGMDAGDVEFALIAAITGCAKSFLVGQNLYTIEANLAKYNKTAAEFNQRPIFSMGSIYQQVTRNLMSDTPQPWVLDGDIYQEFKQLPILEQRGDESSIANLFITKTYVAVMFRQYALAREFAAEARKHFSSVIASPAVPFFIIYESLALAGELKNGSPMQKLTWNLRLKLNLQHLRKWRYHAPENITQGYYLILAEIQRSKHNPQKATDYYELAIAAAKENGYLKEQSLANEFAGRFHLAAGKTDLATHYLQAANAAYTKWGAMNKVATLTREFEYLIGHQSISLSEEEVYAAEGSANQAFQSQQNHTGSSLDLASVIKASQVLAGEIVLEELLKRLMQLVLENAGAHTAHLLLNQSGALQQQIITSFNGKDIEHDLLERPLDSLTNLPLSVVRYVARTQEDLVLNDSREQDGFAQDEYLLREKPKSILCIPILSKAHLTGVLYLENLHTTYAFTEERVTLLKLLASQSAIAIDNAKLYQQLSASRNKYLSLYQNAVEGIFELNGEGLITNINPAAAELLGFESSDDILNRIDLNLQDIFLHPEELSQLTRILLENQRILGYETRLRKVNGDLIWVDLSAHLIFNSAGDLSYVEGSFIDVTERKLRQEAERATQLAEAATKAKSDFLANMSHEIRTPMNAIMGYTDLALITPLTSQQANYLKTIRSSSTHLLRVINDILDISKIESGKIELQLTPFSLADLLYGLEKLFHLSANEKQLKLTFSAFDDKTNFVGDPVRIGQVLINLISNAIKYTDSGSITINASCSTIVENQTKLTFSIKDTGSGIAESRFDSIFESFTQGGPAEKEEAGTGLGLAISKQLVDMMGGEFSVESKLGYGSTFSFFVAIGANQKSGKAEKQQAFRVTASGAAQSRTGLIQGMKILLVEDNIINQKLASEVLKEAGAEITLADNGDEALSALKTDKFDLVLMDMRMPVMDGLEAIKRIRSQQQYRRLPVIALSAGVLQSELEEALESGFDQYLTKPIDFNMLIDLLADIKERTFSEQLEPSVLPGDRNDHIGLYPKDSELLSTRKIPITHDHEEITISDNNPFTIALQNHSGDTEFLKALLGDFLNFYRHAGEELEAFIKEPSHDEQAIRLAHNLAGVSGSFGAMDLVNSARALEKSLTIGDGQAEHHLTDLRAALDQFIKEINLFRSDNQINSANS
ncbi:MAG: PAS domain S-box-containing protein [Candidatus Azotimanducaceae bacterium]|jgi:PAS domain S-box-containing protein